VEQSEHTFALTLSYIGTAFHGFARQDDDVQTVQGALEAALATVFAQPVWTVGAGRTDAGVHALGQVVSFSLPDEVLNGRDLARLCRSLNALTPDDMAIRSLAPKPAGFSARFSAIEREYRYRIVAGDTPPLFTAPFVWWLPGRPWLDYNLLRAAAEHLVGEHDFQSFCVSASSIDKNTVRTVKSISIFGVDHLGEPCTVVQVIGNAFLHSMVRIIVGSLAEVGLGRRPPAWLGEALEAQDRRAAGPTAPAQGLTLWRVRY